jgi:hypothetical protein
MLFIAATVLFSREGGSWLVFALAFFLPDLSMAGYLAGTRTGAMVHNAVHSLTLPLVFALAGVLADQTLVINLSLIWLAHIGFDRLIGYGLKYPEGFKETHLARV